MSKIESRFEIMEDEAPEPKRKQKRKLKNRLSFNYIPWRLVIIMLTAGMTLGIILIFLLMRSRSLTGSAPVAVNTDLSVVSRQIDAPIVDLDFAGDGVAAVVTSNIRIYNKNNLTQILDVPNPSVSLSRDGKVLASVANIYADNRTYGLLQLWDVTTGNLLKELKITGSVSTSGGELSGKSVVFSPDGRLLAIGTNAGIRLLDAETLEQQIVIPINIAGVSALEFSSDSQRLTAIIQYSNSNVFNIKTSVHVWDIHDTKNPRGLYHFVLPIFRRYGQYAALSPDGHYLAYSAWNDADVGTHDGIYIQDLVAQKEVGSISFEVGKHIGALVLSDEFLAFSQVDTVTGEQRNLQVLQWSIDANGLSTQLSAGPLPIRPSGASQLRFLSENGNSGLSYVAMDSNTIMRWDFGTNTVRALPM